MRGYARRMSEPSAFRLVAAEFVGTTLVMLGGPGLIILGADDIGTVGIALGFGLSLAIAIGVLGAVTNPMFSLSLWFGKMIATKELLSDLAGQFLGAIFGAAIVFGLNDSTRYVSGTNGWEPSSDVEAGIDLGLHLSGFASLGVVIAAELVFCTLLVVVMLSSISQQRSNAAMAAFTGGAYALGTMFLLGISGAGMNPARSLGAAIFADTDPNALGQVFLFIVIPVVASVAGLLVWLAIDEAEIDDTVFDDTFAEDLTEAITGDDD